MRLLRSGAAWFFDCCNAATGRSLMMYTSVARLGIDTALHSGGGALRASLTVTVRAQIILLDRFNTVLLTRAIVAAALSVFTVACAEPPKRVNPVASPLSRMKTLPAAVGLGLRAAHWPRRSGIPQRREAANLNGGSASSTPGGTHKRHRCRCDHQRALVVLSHGTGGGAAGMAWLCGDARANGYIVLL